MSSTNRSTARDNHIADYYVTPLHTIKLFLQSFTNTTQTDCSNLKVLDPCAGGNNKTDKDAYHPMSYPTVIKDLYNLNCDTYDIRTDSLAEHKENYLTTTLSYKPDIIISNPPFNLATDFIEKAINDVADNGWVIMLLRLNFFGSQSREAFFEKYMPEYTFVHHIRISFTDKKDENGYTLYNSDGTPKSGGTDSIEYCHMCFHKSNLKPNHSKLILI